MQKVTSTNRQLLDLFKGLDSVKDIKGARFAVLVAKNMKEIKTILDPLEEAAMHSMEFQELSIKMQELIKEENSEAIETLEDESQELIDERKKQLQAVEDMMDNEIDVHLHMIREDQLPEEITGEQVAPLLQIIEQHGYFKCKTCIKIKQSLQEQHLPKAWQNLQGWELCRQWDKTDQTEQQWFSVYIGWRHRVLWF